MKIYSDILRKLKMEFNIHKFIILIFSLILILVIIVSGVFYFTIEKNSARNSIKSNNSLFSIASGVVCHHLLAEKIIQSFFDYIFSKETPEIIVLLSPDHFKSTLLCSKENLPITLSLETKNFEGLKTDNSLLKNLAKKLDFCFNDDFVAEDHGIKNLLPYIKKHSPKTKILPILIPSDFSKEEIENLTKEINSQSLPNTILIASVDFSHYLPKDVANFHDLKSIRVLLNFERDEFKNLEVDCWQCLYGARLFAKLRTKENFKIINWKNSCDFLKSKNCPETTSYFSVVFEKGEKNENSEFQKAKTFLVVGDIMLDRGVENLMKKNNKFYSFKKIENFLRGIDIVTGNLEGPIVKNPPDFDPYSLRFAFSPESIEALKFSHFNLLSLANNHTFDMGKRGFEQTKNFLKEVKIDSFGHPIDCEKNFLIKKDGILFLAFNKTFSFNCSDEKIAEIVKKTRKNHPKDFMIVFFHWGQEYQLKSSIPQRELAHKVIEAGADLIIGSHSHVVQEIEEYQGKLIFYSLGNFIFDQYFSKETQQGLAVGIELYPEKVTYRLFPIESHLSQPFLMGTEKGKELEEIAQKSSPQLFDRIKNGIIEIER